MNQIEVKSVLNKQKRRDDWFLTDYSVNPYSGCSVNCSYCYIRGSKYGENMARTFSVKSNAVEVMERQLRRRAEKKEYGIIGLASATDPYVAIEEKLAITRQILQVILNYRFPVSIGTKTSMVLRDLDLLKTIDRAAILPRGLPDMVNRGSTIAVSISTLDEQLAKILEPGAASPRERLEVVRICTGEGLFAGVDFIPVLPFLSDSEERLDEMIQAAKEYGAQFVFVGGLTLFGKNPSDSKTLYFRFLERHYPDLLPKYSSMYKDFYAPPRSYEATLESTARTLCKRHGIRYRFS